MRAGKVMQLLAALYSSGIGPEAQELLPEMLPRSWPLFRHSLSSVRAACVKCLAALVVIPMQHASEVSAAGHNFAAASKPAPSHWLPCHQLATACRLLFQNVLVEESAAMRRASQDTLQGLVQRCSAADIAAAIPAHLAHSLVQLAGTPSGLAWPAGSLLHIQGPWVTSPATARPFADYPKDASGELAADVRVTASECLASLAAALPPGKYLCHLVQQDTPLQYSAYMFELGWEASAMTPSNRAV